MTSTDFAEDLAFERLEPEATTRDDLRFGLVLSLLANAYRDPKRRRRPYTPQDFFPDTLGEAPRDELEELAETDPAAFALAMARQAGIPIKEGGS